MKVLVVVTQVLVGVACGFSAVVVTSSVSFSVPEPDQTRVRESNDAAIERLKKAARKGADEPKVPAWKF